MFTWTEIALEPKWLRLGNIAILLAVWRPFLAPLCAALYLTEHTGAPMNCYWTRQIAPELDWFAAFFRATGGFIERTFWLNTTLSQQTLLTSFWTPNQVPIEYFTSALCSEGVARFGFELGDPAGQQVWESLAALVAVRLWKAHWQQRRVCLTVRGDSVAMLTLVVNMRVPALASFGLFAKNSRWNSQNFLLSLLLHNICLVLQTPWPTHCRGWLSRFLVSLSLTF